MMRWSSIRGLCLLVILVGLFEVPGVNAQGLPATLFHKSRNKFEVELQGRRGKDGKEWVSVRRKGETSALDLAAAEVMYLRFVPDYSPVEVNQLYGDREYAAAATKMRGFLVRTLRYLDIPNNCLTDIVLLMRCYYRAEQYSEAQRLGRMIAGAAPKGPLRDEARMYAILSLQAMGRMKEAARNLAKEPAISRESKVAPLYWYAVARDALSSGAWDTARDHAEKIVSYGARDFTWLPAGLYLSGKFHMANGSYLVGKQVFDELAIVAPRDAWAGRSAAFLRDFPDWLVAKDRSGRGRNATYEGHPDRGLDGVSASAAESVGFDGVDDRIVLPAALGSGRFSVALWFRSSDKHAGLFSMTGEEGDEVLGATLHISNVGIHMPGQDLVRGRGQDLADGKWHHFVMSYHDGKELVLYVDSRPQLRSEPMLSAPMVSSITFGECATAAHRLLEGGLDEIQVYERALTQADVESLFNRGVSGKPVSGLYAYLPLDEPPFVTMMTVFEDPIEGFTPTEQDDDPKEKEDEAE